MVNKGNPKGLSDEPPPTGPCAAALEAIPPDNWRRTWEACRTIMLRRTSKRVKEQVDKMLLPAVVRLRTTFWGCTRNYSHELINCELAAMVSTCQRTTLVLDFTGRLSWDKADAAKLGGVLAGCPALEHIEHGY
jgi:hypothetical protein